MKAVDTNILVYSHREDNPWHIEAKKFIESEKSLVIPYPCIHEFYSIVTHHKIFNPPSTVSQALQQLEFWISDLNINLIHEKEGYLPLLFTEIHKSKIVGPRIHDLRILCICKINGIKEIFSVDRDFLRFSDIKITNPFEK